MSARILTSSSGSTTRFHEADGKYAIETVADVAPVLDLVGKLRNEGDHRTGMGDKIVGEVPIVVLDKWARAQGLTFAAVMQDQKLLRRFMNDPDNSGFRIAGGRV